MGDNDIKRLNRITTILIQLQSKRVVKAQDIADRFHVSLRTVYRDIKTLEEAGIPLYGAAGKGYSIMEGYKLPPVMFTEEEAMAFLTAEKIVGRFTDNATTLHYKNAMYKVRSVLQYAEKDRIEVLDEHIAVVGNAYLPQNTNNELHLQRLLKAIAAKQVIDIGYTKIDNTKYNNRHVEPVGIYYQGNHWYLVAYCRLRKDYRNFRTDRMSYVTITNQEFNNTHPSLQSFIDCMKHEHELQEVIVDVDTAVLKYLGDQKYYNGFVNEETNGNITRMWFLTASLWGFSKFFLLFGEHATIIEPLSLKKIIAGNLTAIQKKLQ